MQYAVYFLWSNMSYDGYKLNLFFILIGGSLSILFPEYFYYKLNIIANVWEPGPDCFYLFVNKLNF